LSETSLLKQSEIFIPFIGPRSFNRSLADKIRFFGRDFESDEIISLIFSHQLILIYAQSGTGKTSLFNAKVIPELESKGFEVFQMARISNAALSINNSDIKNSQILSIDNMYIFNTLQSLKPNDDPQTFSTMTLSQFLNVFFPIKKDKRGNSIPQLLIFDQFEEIFTFIPGKNWQDQQNNFFKQITEALNNNDNLRIVFIIREDFLAQLQPFSAILPEKLRPRFRLERLKRENALLAIKEPLRTLQKPLSDYSKEEIDTQIEKIVDELLEMNVEDPITGESTRIKGEYVEPIQLQVVCQRWWKEMSSGKYIIDKSHLKALADVNSALEDFYDSSVTEASNQIHIDEGYIRKLVDDKLITSSDTRAFVHKGALTDFIQTLDYSITIEKMDKLIDILEKKYLIRREWRSGANWYELTHDRIIGPIKKSNSRWKESKRYKEFQQRLKYKRFQQRLKKQRRKITIMLISFIPIILLIVYLITWYNAQYIIPTAESISVADLPFRGSVDQTTGLLYVTNPKTDSINVINGKRNNVIASITGLDEPTDITVDSNNNLIYVSQPFSKIISVIKGSTNKIVKNIIFDDRPVSIDVDSQNYKLYATYSLSNKLVVIDTTSDKILKTIEVGDNPGGVYADSKFNKVYVANEGDNTVSVINGTNYDILKTIPVGISPGIIAFNPNDNKVYVANRGDNTVSVINGTNYDILKTIPVGISPRSIAFNPNDNKVYVANEGDNTVSVIDTNSDMEVAILNVGMRPTDVSINFNQKILYVINNLDNSIRAIDMDGDLGKAFIVTSSSTPVFTKIPVGSHPSGITIDNSTELIYVANTDSNTVSVIDSKTNLKIEELNVGKKPRDISIHTENGMVYVSNSMSDTVSIIDRANNLIKDISTGGKYPTGLSVNERANLIYVANTDSDTVSIIDGKTNQVISTITVGNSPTGIAVDEKNNLIYVTNYNDDSVSVINGTTNLGDILIFNNFQKVGPTSMVVNSDNNKLYVLNTISKSISLIDIDVIINSLENSGKIINNYKYVITIFGNYDYSPYDISLNTNTKTIYITNKNENVTNIEIMPV
jgi:YVTN family beta-propeller protein